MRKVSKATLKENDTLYAGCVFLEPREWLDNAILGKCATSGGIIYDADILTEAYMERDNISIEQASMVVSYNATRALHYMPKPHPIIQYNDKDEDCKPEEDYD